METQSEPKIYASVDEMVASGAADAEYATIEGFKPGEVVRIGSVTASDIIEWSEASEGEAKKTMGLRLICRSLVGPAPGNVRYADNDKNIARFRTMRHKETERIVREILKLNGMTVKQERDAKNG